jgi:hypothetical protein
MAAQEERPDDAVAEAVEHAGPVPLSRLEGLGVAARCAARAHIRRLVHARAVCGRAQPRRRRAPPLPVLARAPRSDVAKLQAAGFCTVECVRARVRVRARRKHVAPA